MTVLTWFKIHKVCDEIGGNIDADNSISLDDV